MTFCGSGVPDIRLAQTTITDWEPLPLNPVQQRPVR
jgi:hypothetical protein